MFPLKDPLPRASRDARARPCLTAVLALASLLAVPLRADESLVADGVHCTLGDAILSANTGSAIGGCTSGSPGHDRIVLDYDVVLQEADTVHSTHRRGAYAGLPEVTSALTLEAGQGSVIERDGSAGCDSASNPFRLLHVFGGSDLVLRGLTLRGGCAASATHNTSGGAVLVKFGGKLRLDGCTFTGNTAWSAAKKQARGGAVAVETATSVLSAVTGSVFVGNLAQSGDTINNKAANNAYGGALAVVNGSLGTILTSEFRDNEARGGSAEGADGGRGFGGAVAFYTAVAGTVERTLFEGNRAIGGDSLAADSGHGRGGGLYADDSAVGEIRTSFFRLNESLGGHGDRSGQGSGGGLHVSGSGSLDSLTQTTFSANRAVSGEGNLNSIEARGGGVYFVVPVAEVSNNTFLRNVAVGGRRLTAGAGGNGTGGGLRTTKSIPRFVHNTFRGNQALGGFGAPDGTGVGRDLYGGPAQINASNNLFWDGHPGDVDGWIPVAACRAGNFVSAGYNLVDDPGACVFDGPRDLFGVDPLGRSASNACAEPLLDGGCPLIWTIDTESPALDQGSCATSGLVEDGRGAARPYDELTAGDADDGCDIGAYEYDGTSAGPPPPCEDCDA